MPGLVEPADAVRVVVGLVLLVGFPGWAWSRALVPRAGRIERLVYSVALSISLLSLALYVGNLLFGIAVSAAHAVWYSLALTLGGAALWAHRRPVGAARRRA